VKTKHSEMVSVH